jgi:hypothetical protein
MMHVIWSGLRGVLGRGTWMCLLECESGAEHAGFVRWLCKSRSMGVRCVEDREMTCSKD